MKLLNTLINLFTITSIFISCDNSELEIPSCIQEKITELKYESIQNPPAKVWEWKTNNNIYYYITSDCCDQFNYLYNINCEIVCAPDGGFSGLGDGKCPDFNESIKKSLIWEDSRK